MRLVSTLLKTIGITAILLVYLVFTYGVLPRTGMGLATLFVIGLPIALLVEVLMEKARDEKNSLVRVMYSILSVGIIVAFMVITTMYRGVFDRYFYG